MQKREKEIHNHNILRQNISFKKEDNSGTNKIINSANYQINEMKEKVMIYSPTLNIISLHAPFMSQTVQVNL